MTFDHSKISNRNKIFPKLGILPFSKEVSIDNFYYIKQVARDILSSIRNTVSFELFNLKDKQSEHFRTLNALLSVFLPKLEDSIIDQWFITDNVLKIKLPYDIYDINGNVFFKKGQSIFKIYETLVKLFKNCGSNLPEINLLPSFKEFSQNNFPQKLFVNFSYDTFDIATMSMRGFTTCLSWTGDKSHLLQGTIDDPDTGIIYLTSNKKYNTYGSKMIKRCLVRFVVSETDKKPYLFLDKMYPSFEQNVLNVFIQNLSGKFNVIYGPNSEHIYYLPHNKSVQWLDCNNLKLNKSLCINLDKIKIQNLIYDTLSEKLMSINERKALKSQIDFLSNNIEFLSSNQFKNKLCLNLYKSLDKNILFVLKPLIHDMVNTNISLYA